MNKLKSSRFKNRFYKISILLFFVLLMSVFGIKSFAEDVTSSSSNVSSASIPKAPSELTYTAPTASMIHLVWKDNSNNEDKFNIERKLSNELNYSFLTQVTIANTTSYNDTSIMTGSYYDYRVQACLTGTGCSEYTTLSRATTLNASEENTETIPCASLALNLNDSKTTYKIGDSVSYTWTCSPANTSNVYVLLQKPNGNSVVYSNTGSGAGTKEINTSNLSAGTYTIKACLSSTCNVGPVTVSQTFRLISGDDNNTTPTDTDLTTDEETPTNEPCTSLILTLKDSKTTYKIGDSVSYTWKCSAGVANDVSVWLQKLNGTPTLYDNSLGQQSRTKEFSTSNLIPGTYTLKACLGSVCTTGLSMSSQTFKIVTEDNILPTTTIPLAPSNLSLDKNIISKFISLNWKDNSNNEDKFNIGRKLSTSTTWSNLTQVGANMLHYVDTEVRVELSYDYRVQACLSSVGCSGYTYLYKITPANNSGSDEMPTTTPIVTPTKLENTEVPNSQETSEDDVKPLVTKEENRAKTQDKIEEVRKENVTEIVNKISNTEDNKNKPVVQEDKKIDLVYKDSNHDGISDYDSTYVYNIDPVKSSPVSTFEGREISASEKILLGFDPTKSELVKVEREQPVESSAETVSSYKVNEMSLTTENKIILKGQALPNSFITIYIYSTPIIVTVKTDSNGEWEYVLDKELENGEHTVYTATVNNTGNIIAKSSGYLFTKTAEAVSLNDVPITSDSVIPVKPGFFKGVNLYLVILGSVIIVIAVLVLVGATGKKNNNTQQDNNIQQN